VISGLGINIDLIRGIVKDNPFNQKNAKPQYS